MGYLGLLFAEGDGGFFGRGFGCFGLLFLGRCGLILLGSSEESVHP